MSKIEVILNDDLVGLAIDEKAFRILGTIPPQPKGAPKHLKRLIRIRLNLFRELQALNKELRRHPIP